MTKKIENIFEIIFEKKDKFFKKEFLILKNKIKDLKEISEKIEKKIYIYQNKIETNKYNLIYIQVQYTEKEKNEKLIFELIKEKNELTKQYREYIMRKKIIKEFFIKKRKDLNYKYSTKEDQIINDMYVNFFKKYE